MKLKKLFCVALSALVMLLSGCSEIAQTSEEYIPPEYTPQAYPITVEGISFEKSPSAIVCLSPTLADMLFELDAADRLVAANIEMNSLLDNNRGDFDIAQCSGAVNPDVDEILSYSPDLVLTSTPMGAMDVKKITDSGAKFLYIPPACDIPSMMEMYSMLSLICYGDIVAMQKVDEATAPLFSSIENMSKLASDKSFAFLQTQSFYPASDDTFIGSVLDAAYGDNVFADARYSGDISKISELAPDFIFLSSDIDEATLSENISLPESSHIIHLKCDEKLTTATNAMQIISSASGYFAWA